MQQSAAADDSGGGPGISRRLVLTALATGAGAAGLNRALDSQGAAGGGGELALGDDGETRIRSAWQHDGFYLAPETVPPESGENQLVWLFNDDLGIAEMWAPDTLPASWSATGLQFGADTTLSGARSAAGTPGFAMVFDADPRMEIQAPDQDVTINSDGIEIIMASDLDAAQNRYSGDPPAVLFGLDGIAEVIVDG